jgi:hypothetical protein
MVDDRFDEALFKAGLARFSRTDIAETRPLAPAAKMRAAPEQFLPNKAARKLCPCGLFRKPSERYCGLAKVVDDAPAGLA